MKRMMIVVAALLMASPLFAQQKTFLDQPYIEVTGRAEMEVAPDEIYVRITINEQDSKGKTTVLQQEKDMVRRLKDLGIDVDEKLVVQDMMNAQLKKEIGRLKQAARQSRAWADKVENTKIGPHSAKVTGEADAMGGRAYIGEQSRRMQQRRKNLERRQNAAIEEKSALLKNIEQAAPL